MKTKEVINTMMGLFLTASFILLAACSEDGKKRVATRPGVSTFTSPTGTSITTCNNCSNSQLIAVALGDSIPGFADQFQMRMNFFFTNESNQVAADGYIDIQNLSSVGFCGFIPGRYRVGTVSGQFGELSQNGMVTGLTLEAIRGSEVIRMRLNYATFDLFNQGFIRGCDGKDYPDPLGAELVVESLNGQLCNIGNFNKKIYPTGNKNFNCSINK